MLADTWRCSPTRGDACRPRDTFIPGRTAHTPYPCRELRQGPSVRTAPAHRCQNAPQARPLTHRPTFLTNRTPQKTPCAPAPAVFPLAKPTLRTSHVTRPCTRRKPLGLSRPASIFKPYAPAEHFPAHFSKKLLQKGKDCAIITGSHPFCLARRDANPTIARKSRVKFKTKYDRYASWRVISPKGEDTRTLRLTSKRLDLRVGYAKWIQ